jgi:putative flippase GtrA
VTRWKLPEFGRFLSVGVVNALVGLLVIYAAKWFLQLGDIAANAGGYAVGLAISFALNSRWTFVYRGTQWPAFVRFLLVALAAYGLNLLVVMASIRLAGINSYIAQALGIPVYTLTMYLGSKYIVFRMDSHSHE